MVFILDASVAACWAFEDEQESLADAALDLLNASSAYVPELWWFEIRNTLIINERRCRKTAAETASYLGKLTRFSILVDHAPVERDTLDLARRHVLTVYDAAYLELARRRAEPLATLDRKLAAAARAESVPLIGAP